MESGPVVKDAFTGLNLTIHLEDEKIELRPTHQEALANYYISPGWVDMQVNGFAGYDVNQPELSVEAIHAITARLWQEGVTAWCPTLISAPEGQIERSLDVLRQACEHDPWVRSCVPGFHLEGPYISPADGIRGAHPLAAIHPPDWAEFSRWQAAAGGRIRIVTLAPEIAGAIDFIRQLRRSGVIPAIGHSNASTACIRAAAAAGAQLSTHLGNGIASTLPRHPNPIWDQLAEDGLYASLIFDGFHLPGSVMKVFLRAKGTDRCLLVSDASALARQQPGVYETPVGGKVELHASGRLSLYGSEYLAGSASSLKDGVENALRLAACSLAEAVGLVSNNPARLLGFRQNASTIFFHNPVDGRVKIMAACLDGQVMFRNPDF